MELLRRIVVWSSVVALIQCGGFNTPDELRIGREAINEWRSRREDNSHPGDRVFGGFPTYVSLYPFAVYILGKDEVRYWDCSGSILAPSWVLTAAHCMSLRKWWSAVIFAGDVDFSNDRLFTKFNIQIRALKQAYQYKVNDTYLHDIALYKPWRSFVLEHGFVETIPLTEVRRYPQNFEEICTIVGFGERGRNLNPPAWIQRAASFRMVPGWKCGEPKIRDNGLCTFDVKTKSACSGDSGGPIFCSGRFIQFGVIVGARYENCTFWYCGAPAEWNIHMFVGFYHDWIIQTMNRYPYKRSSDSHRRSAASLVTLLVASLLLAELSRSINTRIPL